MGRSLFYLISTYPKRVHNFLHANNTIRVNIIILVTPVCAHIFIMYTDYDNFCSHSFVLLHYYVQIYNHLYSKCWVQVSGNTRIVYGSESPRGQCASFRVKLHQHRAGWLLADHLYGEIPTELLPSS